MPQRAGATLAAYAVGLIPFVMIRSAAATFYARQDTATPVKAALTGVAVNVALKIALVGSLAQVGLALAHRHRGLGQSFTGAVLRGAREAISSSTALADRSLGEIRRRPAGALARAAQHLA